MKEARKALIINLFGGPAAGKSTVAAGVFSLLKLHSIDCELIQEYAKELVWEERYKTFKNQQYIFAKQHHRIWRVSDKVDIVVTDCPLMLSLIYGERYKATSPEFTSNVLEVVNGFDNYNVFLNRVRKYNINGRNETEVEAKEMDMIIKDSLTEHSMPWTEASGDLGGINTIVKTVLKQRPIFKICM